MRFLILAVLAVWCGVGYAEIPREKAVYAVIGEAENDNMLALACALRIRGDLRGVYGLYSKRVTEHLYTPRTFVLAVKAWEISRHAENCRFIGGADSWQSNADMKKPLKWRDRCIQTYRIEKTVYFNCKH